MLIYHESGVGVEVEYPTSALQTYGYDDLMLTGLITTVPNSHALLVKLVHISANAVVAGYNTTPTATFTFNLLSRNYFLNQEFWNFVQMVHDYFLVKFSARFEPGVVEDSNVYSAANEALLHYKALQFWQNEQLALYNGELSPPEKMALNQYNKEINDRKAQIAEIYQRTPSTQVMLGSNLTPNVLVSSGMPVSIPYEGQALEDQYQASHFPNGYAFETEEAWMTQKELNCVAIVNTPPPDVLVFSQGRTQEQINRLNQTQHKLWEEKVSNARTSLRSARKSQENTMNRQQHQLYGNYGVASPGFQRRPQPMMPQTDPADIQFLQRHGIDLNTIQAYLNQGWTAVDLGNFLVQNWRLPPLNQNMYPSGNMQMNSGFDPRGMPNNNQFARDSTQFSRGNTYGQRFDVEQTSPAGSGRFGNNRQMVQAEPQVMVGGKPFVPFTPNGQTAPTPIQDVSHKPYPFQTEDVSQLVADMAAAERSDSQGNLPKFTMDDVQPIPKEKSMPTDVYSEKEGLLHPVEGFVKEFKLHDKEQRASLLNKFSDDVAALAHADLGNLEVAEKYQAYGPSKWIVETSLETAISDARLKKQNIKEETGESSMVYRRFVALVEGLPYPAELSSFVKEISKAERFLELSTMMSMNAVESAQVDSVEIRRKKMVLLSNVNRRVTRLINDFLKYNLNLKDLSIDSFQEDINDLYDYLTTKCSSEDSARFRAFSDDLIGTYLHAVSEEAQRLILENLDIEENIPLITFFTNTSITLIDLTEDELGIKGDLFQVNENNGFFMSTIVSSIKTHMGNMNMPVVQHVIVTEDDSRFLVYIQSKDFKSFILKRL